MSIDEHLFNLSEALMRSYPDNIRHPIIIEEKENLAALGQTLLMVMGSGQAIEGVINVLNVILETCYCLGYQAGKGDVELDEVWYED